MPQTNYNAPMTRREMQILEMRYKERKSFAEISRKCQVSRDRIRSLHDRAIRKLLFRVDVFRHALFLDRDLTLMGNYKWGE